MTSAIELTSKWILMMVIKFENPWSEEEVHDVE